MRYKHQRYQGGLLIVNYTSMYTRSQKGIKTRMETTVGLYGKGNEIISWPSLYVGLCFVLSGNYCYMWYHCWSMLHQIYMSQISNDNVHQGTQTISNDDNIHSSLCVVGKRWKTFLCMWVPLYNAIASVLSRYVSWVTMCSFMHGQHSKWIPNSSMVWPHSHHEICKIVKCDIPKRIWSVIKKWVEDK
jgi:hypothetical protein